MDSGVSGPPVASRPDEGMSTATTQRDIPTLPPPAPPPEVHVPKCEHRECTRKHSGSEHSGQNSGELLDARHARLPVWGSHILVNASRIKMPGKIAAEQHQRRSRNVELLEIRTHDRWTEFEFNRSRAEEDKNNLCDRKREFGEPNG